MPHPTLINKISNLYKNNDTLYRKYGHDVWISICIIIIFVFAITYTHIVNHLQSLKVHWVKDRCNPLFMPFAAYINNVKNSKLEYVLSNFVYCITSITKDSTEIALDPIYYLANSQTNLMQANAHIANDFRDIYSTIRNRLQSISQEAINIATNIMTPFYIIIITLQDTFRKIVATLTTAMFTLVSVYRLMKLFIINIGTIVMLEIFLPLLTMFLLLLGIYIGGLPLGVFGPSPYLLPMLIPMGIIVLIVYLILSLIVAEINHLFREMGITQSEPPPGV